MAWQEAISLYFVGASFVLAYLACNAVKPTGVNNEMPRPWIWVKPLFLMASMLTMGIGFANLRHIGAGADQTTAPANVLTLIDSAYKVGTYSYWAFFALFLAVFLYEIFRGYKSQQEAIEGDSVDESSED